MNPKPGWIFALLPRFDKTAWRRGRQQEVRPGVDQRDEVLHKIERAEDRETAHAAAHAFVRWMEELDVLD